MSRLPFDPSRAQGAPSAGGASSGKRGEALPLTVSQVAGEIKIALTEYFPAKVRVVGEVSNLRDRQHWFFSLKDENASIRCVCFASAARKVKVRIEDGMQIVVTGRVDFFDGQGAVQIYVDHIEAVGQGALELALRQLMEELREAGYFAAERKKALPLLPRKVAVVTSRAAAALQDVINTAHRRWPGCRLYLMDVRVQGEAAAGEIAHAIQGLSEHGPGLGIEGIIVTRGGGSIEDLWAFNERIVADAIFHCRLPIVAAIGHETDTTVAELVADARCATPTQAAMRLIPDRAALDQQMTQIGQRLTLMVKREWKQSQQRLEAAARHTLFRSPGRFVEQAGQRLEQDAVHLRRSLPRRLGIARDKLDALERHLDAVGPMNVLGRGYTYTLGADGAILRSAGGARPGDELTTVLVDGRVVSRVRVDGEASAPSPPRQLSRPRGSKKKRSTDDGQGGLFAG